MYLLNKKIIERISQINHEDIQKILLNAGEITQKYFNNIKNLTIEIKKDKSLVTIADKLSHDYIVKSLEALYNIPIISEEGDITTHKNIRKEKWFWLIDPLDGTRGFIKQKEYSINISLIYLNKPILGYIYLPRSKKLYFTKYNEKNNNIESYIRKISEKSNVTNSTVESEKINLTTKANNIINENNKNRSKLSSSLNYLRSLNKSIKIVTNHRTIKSQNCQIFFEKLKCSYEIIFQPCAYKFCLFLEKKIDIYISNSELMEWDIAAGNALIIAAGAMMLTYPEEQELKYGKENLFGENFVCFL